MKFYTAPYIIQVQDTDTHTQQVSPVSAYDIDARLIVYNLSSRYTSSLSDLTFIPFYGIIGIQITTRL